jgi:hypothetical protein
VPIWNLTRAMTFMTVRLLPDLAGNILRSLQLGDSEALENALDRAEEASEPQPSVPPDEAERLELIGAIASAMRADVRHRRSPRDNAYVPLLHHLQKMASAAAIGAA